MNRKGFTLVELLAVLVILFGISLVVVGGISSSLERRDEKEYKEQQELAIGAAKIYFSLNKGVNSVSVVTLKNNKFIEKKVDRLLDCDVISISNSEYIYTVCNQ